MEKALNESRILVTGGAGFIGSALVWDLNRRGCEQIVITDFLGSSEKWRNLSPLRFEDYLEADSLIQNLESGRLGKFDYVLHMGACSSTTERNMTYLVRNNFEFTKELAAWSLAQDARFVYASSAATYGDGSEGMSDTDEEIGRFRPLNAYGYSKQLFDLYALRQGWFSKIARLFKSYRSEYSDGAQQRDFLYVKDATDMTIHVAESDNANGLFNIGSGEAHSWNELASAIFTATKHPPRIDYIEMPEALRDKYQYFTQADIGKLRSNGYDKPITRLADAIRDYITQYLAADRRLGDESSNLP